MKKLTRQLLDWYALCGRDMPWRVKGGAAENTYGVWISEIMLQQTTVATVVDYYLRWMKKFPTLQSLANAPLDDVLHAWQGLGYYTRAKKIYECAGVLMKQYGGTFPKTREELLKLPGIGPYSASSICAFAFNQPETVVDGNVIRVIARLYGMTDALGREDIYPLAKELTPSQKGADYASAIMDLGATICKPQNPDCELCPWQGACKAYHLGIQNDIPLIRKPIKKKKKGSVFLAFDSNGRVLIQKRQKGLLSGLYELPWCVEGFCPPTDAKWQEKSVKVHHVFTHIDLTLSVFEAKDVRTDGLFVPVDTLSNYAVSTLMKKVFKACGFFIS